MPRHRWSLLCRRAIVDKHSNLLSILEVLEETVMQESPPRDAPEDQIGIALDGFLVSVWDRDYPEKPETFWQTVTVTGPKGEAFRDAIRLEGNLRDHLRIRLLMGIRAIKFQGPGVYTFNVHCSETEGDVGELVDQVPLVVKAPPDPTSSTEPEQPSEQS